MIVPATRGHGTWFFQARSLPRSRCVCVFVWTIGSGRSYTPWQSPCTPMGLPRSWKRPPSKTSPAPRWTSNKRTHVWLEWFYCQITRKQKDIPDQKWSHQWHPFLKVYVWIHDERNSSITLVLRVSLLLPPPSPTFGENILKLGGFLTHPVNGWLLNWVAALNS